MSDGKDARTGAPRGGGWSLWGRIGRIIGTAWLLGVAGLSVRAQEMVGGGVGYNAVVAKLLSEFPAFSASVETLMTNKADRSRLSVPMAMSKRGDLLRIEVDLGKMKGTGVSLDQITAMQNIGLARMAMVVHPAERVMFVVFPEVKFATQVAMSPSDVMDAAVKVTKRRSGKEKLGGLAVVRQQVTMTGTDGRRTEATTWEDPSLNNFPARIAFKQQETSVEMTFVGATLTSAPEDRYGVPADYRKFDSMSTLMEEARKKVLDSQ